jgi:hypothetical protein
LVVRGSSSSLAKAEIIIQEKLCEIEQSWSRTIINDKFIPFFKNGKTIFDGLRTKFKDELCVDAILENTVLDSHNVNFETPRLQKTSLVLVGKTH